jgi:hypothetical protein
MMLNAAASPVLFCFLGRGTEMCDADRGETLLLRCAPVDWMSPGWLATTVFTHNTILRGATRVQNRGQ